ncbi:hypothetical protein ACFVVX_03670 [Kitasatospora sp. NPDC058170]
MGIVLLAGLFVSVLFVGVVAQITATRQPRERRTVRRDLASGYSSTSSEK